MSNSLTPEERAELEKLQRRDLAGMPESDFRRYVALMQKSRGREIE
jgi:hypothetical protein